MKKSITRKEYHLIEGLVCLGNRYARKLDEINNLICEVMEADDGYCGHLSDALYEFDSDVSLDKKMEYEGVEVEETCVGG